eukprot:403360376
MERKNQSYGVPDMRGMAQQNGRPIIDPDSKQRNSSNSQKPFIKTFKCSSCYLNNASRMMDCGCFYCETCFNDDYPTGDVEEQQQCSLCQKTQMQSFDLRNKQQVNKISTNLTDPTHLLGKVIHAFKFQDLHQRKYVSELEKRCANLEHVNNDLSNKNKDLQVQVQRLGQQRSNHQQNMQSNSNHMRPQIDDRSVSSIPIGLPSHQLGGRQPMRNISKQLCRNHQQQLPPPQLRQTSQFQQQQMQQNNMAAQSRQTLMQRGGNAGNTMGPSRVNSAPSMIANNMQNQLLRGGYNQGGGGHFDRPPDINLINQKRTFNQFSGGIHQRTLPNNQLIRKM